MNKEKLEVPIELDAKILQYAAEKKFVRQVWYRSLPARAAALIIFGAAFALLQTVNRTDNSKNIKIAENIQVQQDVPDWNDFEKKLEFVDEEIFAEAVYLAQL